MWICKECGCPVIAEYQNEVRRICEVDKNLNVAEIHLEEVMYENLNEYYCDDCGESSDSIEEIADWED